MKTFFSKIAVKFNNTSLRVKLIILFFFVGIIPLLLLSFFSYYSTDRQLTDQKRENLISSSRQIASNIESMLTPVSQISMILSTNTELDGYLMKQFTRDIDYVTAYDYINGFLYNFLIANADIQQITFYIDNPTIPSDGLFIRHIEEFPIDEWDRISGSKQDLAYYASKTKGGTHLLLFGRPLNYFDASSPHGYLSISVRESAIAALFSHKETESNVFVIDSGGNVISTDNKENLSASIWHIIPDYPKDSLSGAFIGTVHGERSMVAYSELSNGWTAIVTSPMRFIRASIIELSSRILIVSAVCIFIALLLIYQISKYFSSSFSLLNQQIEMVENNDFSFYIEPMGNDEVGQLGRALNKMARKLNNAINEVYKKELQQKDTELRLLQSQLNPHFLYNALSGISTMALRSKDVATSEFASHLSQFYKMSLSGGREFIPLRDEIVLTKHYIAIQETRFTGMFFFSWNIDETFLDVITPKLILQPFIENIVNHASRDDGRPVTVTIEIAQCGENSVAFRINDTGNGIPPELLSTLLANSEHRGFGIRNVDARIKLAFGSEYGVKITSHPGIGTNVTVVIPDTRSNETLLGGTSWQL
jgi:two-component system sensor histidine kinase YesM